MKKIAVLKKYMGVAKFEETKSGLIFQWKCIDDKLILITLILSLFALAAFSCLKKLNLLLDKNRKQHFDYTDACT